MATQLPARMSRVYGVALGSAGWIIGGTALAWWLGGKAWGVGVFAVTILTMLLTMGIVLFNYSCEQNVAESRRNCGGSVRCRQCGGTGWVRRDAYNEVTCPVCNGSGSEDARRQGPPQIRGT